MLAVGEPQKPQTSTNKYIESMGDDPLRGTQPCQRHHATRPPAWILKKGGSVTAAPALHNERRSMCRLGCDRSGPRQCKAAGPPPINFPRVRNILSVPLGPEGARIRSSMITRNRTRQALSTCLIGKGLSKRVRRAN